MKALKISILFLIVVLSIPIMPIKSAGTMSATLMWDGPSDQPQTLNWFLRFWKWIWDLIF